MSNTSTSSVRATNKLIPELRFPEFEALWKIITLSEVCDVFRGGTFSKADMDENGTEPCIHYGELFTKYNEVISYIFSKTNKSDGFRSQAGDILMPSSDVTPNGLAKASAIIIDDVVLGGDMNIIRPKTDINSIFLSYLLNYSKSEIIKLVSGTTVKHIYPSQIINCQIPIINCQKEQQKIACCLSSLDELIAAHNHKLDSLKDHKKGLMQNLFPQEGETVPKYRFPEFLDDGDWAEKVLSEVADYENGKAHEKDIDEGGDFVVVNSKFISTEGQTVKYSNSAICLAKNGDILMVLSDLPNGKAIAKCFYVNEDDRYTVNQRICKITPFDCENVFLFYIMNRNSYFLGFDDGVKQTNLRNQDVQNFPFLLPDNPKEQQKIASCLASLDSLISEQGEKIEQLKLHKKGLMQGLFPRVND